jgi:hypothetical protein
MKKPKSIYERNGHNYVTYDNPDTANIINERFYLEKKLFGVRVYKKTWHQDSNIMDRRALKQTGFRK